MRLKFQNAQRLRTAERPREGRPCAGGRECATCPRGRALTAWLRPEGLPRSGSGSSSVGGERGPAARPGTAGIPPRGRGRPQPAGREPGGCPAGTRRSALRCVRWLRGHGRRRRRQRLWIPEDTLPVARASGRGAPGAADRTAPHAERRKPRSGPAAREERPRRKVPRGGAESGTSPGGCRRAPAQPGAGAAGDMVALCGVSRSPLLLLTFFKTGEMNWSGRPAR